MSGPDDPTDTSSNMVDTTDEEPGTLTSPSERVVDHHHHRHRAAFVALCVLGALVLAGAFAARWVQPPEPGAFYQPPDPLPTGDPGAVLRWEVIDPGIPGATGARILHLSTDPENQPIAVSSVIVWPIDSQAGDDRPVVAWAHGTTGVAERCAPSLLSDQITAVPGIEEMVAAGWVVTATDYPGLGTPGPHPYLVGQSEARAVLDSVRAARQLDIGAGERFVTWGHSQGGHASLWSAQIAASYAPELELLGASAAAPAIELAQLLRDDQGTLAGNVLSSFALVAWSQHFPDAPLEAITTRPGAALATRIARGCIETEEQLAVIGPAAVAELASLLSADPTTTEPWASYIAENEPTDPIDVPIYVAQGTADQIVRPPTTREALENRCDLGETVQLQWFPGLGHVPVAAASAPFAVEWMRGRFANDPAPDNCDEVGGPIPPG
jgi:alpha-beta hydrolase superfamily lysophospholipase